MMKTSAKPPDTIALNAIDRSFLIPETADIHGGYFPITSMVAVRLQRSIEPDAVLTALNQLEISFPQLRLGYRLDLDHLRWQRVPDDQMNDHLAAMISTYPETSANLETALSEIVSTNIAPFSLPIQIIIHQNTFILRLNHSFSDGMLAAFILKYILTAIDAPQIVNDLPNLNSFHGLPLVQIIREQPDFLLNLLRGWLKTVRDFSPSSNTDLQPEKRNPARKAIASGSSMRVKLHRIPARTIKQIKALRKRFSTSALSISMNTLLQVLVAHRLYELGYLGQQVNYTIPVDLHRYLSDPATYYTGNLSSQIRVTVTDTPLSDIGAHCYALQASVDSQLEARIPLYSPTLDWLMRPMGRERYNQMNRDWYNESINTDPRLFVLSNMGDVTRAFRNFKDLIDFDAGMFAIAPLMGGPPLVIILGIVSGQGNLGITYDPQIFNESQINEIFALFTSEWLTAHINSEDTTHALDY